MSDFIGIDLGSTKCCVGVFQNGVVDIRDVKGHRFTPSCIAFTDRKYMIGESAKEELHKDPQNTVYGLLRLIDRKFNDASIQSDMKHWPFQLISSGGYPKIRVKYQGTTKDFNPEEIVKLILKELIDYTQLGVVITVPAAFNYSQRDSIREAGMIRSFQNVHVIAASTATVLAFGFGKGLKRQNVLVFDLGGGTCDVSIVTIDNNSYEVKAVAGDAHLGGEDLDNRLVDHFVAEFEKKYKKKFTTSPVFLNRLRTVCQKVKHRLSISTKAAIIFDGNKFVITRATFDELCSDLFAKIIDPIESALRNAEINKRDISEVILVGGSTRIPKVREILSEFFDGKELNTSMNADESAARGAAIFAAIVLENKHESIKNLVFRNLLPLPISIKTSKGLVPFIRRNTPLPTTVTTTFLPRYGNQGDFSIKIYEGEQAMIEHNTFLHKIVLQSIPPARDHILNSIPPVRRVRTGINLDFSISGILHVSARPNWCYSWRGKWYGCSNYRL